MVEEANDNAPSMQLFTTQGALPDESLAEIALENEHTLQMHAKVTHEA